MAGEVRVVVRGERELRLRLEGLGQIPRDRKMLEGIGMLGVRDVQRGIREQRSPDGKPYPKVSRYGSAGRRLRDTGGLLGSITYEISGPSRVTVGTNKKQGPLQHFGGEVTSNRPGGLLAIPATRQIARAVASQGGFRAAFKDAFVLKSIDGSLLLVRRRPEYTVHDVKGTDNVKLRRSRKAGQLELLASLRRRVRIPGTGFNDLSDRGRDDMINLIARTIRQRAEGGR